MLVGFFAGLAAFIHVYIFCLESLLWGRPKTNRIFKVSPDVAEHNRLFAFNQGFYNLFLAVAVIGGLAAGLQNPVGRTLVLYALASMMMAAVVLLGSSRALWRAALIQGLCPLLGLLCLGFGA